jgi:carbon-monoxide dehydrogenase medium subunit
VRIPIPAPRTGIAHRKLSFHERPAATVAAAVRAESGIVIGASIAVGSVGARPVRAAAAAEALVGKPSTDVAALAEAATLAAEAADAAEDANGSIEYKQQLVRVLVERCVKAAVSDAGASWPS